MPGAGVKSENLAKLVTESGATEYHASARVVVDNPLTYINTNINDYGKVYVSLESELVKMVEILNYASMPTGIQL